MNSRLLSLLLIFILAAWLAPPLGAQGVEPPVADTDDNTALDEAATAEDEAARVEAERLEKRLASASLLNLVPHPGDVGDDAPETDIRQLAEQAMLDEDPVVAYYGAVVLAKLDDLALPTPPEELGGVRVPPEIPAGVSFTEPYDWDAFLVLTSDLRSESLDVRLAAINGLITLAAVTRPAPAPEVVAELQALLGDGAPQVAHMAARAVGALVPPDTRVKNTSPLGRLSSEEELWALVDASLGENETTAEERLVAMEALLEGATMTPLADDAEVLRVFETAAQDEDLRIAYFGKMALSGGLAGDPDALAGTWVAPVDPYVKAQLEAASAQPPSVDPDAEVQPFDRHPESGDSRVYVNPDQPAADPGDQPESPAEREELATYVEVAPNVWVNTAPPRPDPGMQEQPVVNQ